MPHGTVISLMSAAMAQRAGILGYNRRMSPSHVAENNGAMPRPKMLLHVCCAPCSAHVTGELAQNHQMILYFFNPNIHPREEYERRRDEARRWAEGEGIEFIEEPYRPEEWFARTKGMENEPEKGARCRACFDIRMEAAAAKASQMGADIFGAALSVSPHKRAEDINTAGNAAGGRAGVPFMAADFKKREGFKLAMKKARELGLYRQDYCGCIYSMRKNKG